MCEINVVVSSIKNKKKIIKSMNDKIIHRGPDAEGYYVDDYVALGQRRLSIIDLEGGVQPMYNEDKSLVIVFNGEIYNYQELKSELTNHIFSTNSDTEVLIHGYEEWGVELLNKLRGMFSFCLYDIENNEMLLARDHFGIKPLYYYKGEEELLSGGLL